MEAISAASWDSDFREVLAGLTPAPIRRPQSIVVTQFPTQLLALVPSLETARQDVDSSFERFCLTAGIGAIEQMLRDDAQQLTGTPLIANSSLISACRGFAITLGCLRTPASLARKCCAVLRSLRRTT